MKIVQLTAENVKRVIAVTITPAGNLTVVGGANGAGKSSVLDSIMYALNGKGSHPPEPLRRGAENGKVVVKLDGDDSRQLSPLTVTRTFRPGGKSDLEIRTDDGYAAPSPQGILDDLCGRIAFDPLEFTRRGPKQQADTLRQLVGLDFAELDRNRATLYAERTAVNRDAKQVRAEVSASPVVPDAPAEEVSVATLSEELEQRIRGNEANSSVRAEMDAAVDQRTRLHNDVTRLRARLSDATEIMENHDATVVGLRERVDALVDEPTDEIRAQIAGAEDANSMVRQNKQAAELKAKLAAIMEEAAGLTEAIDQVDADKAAQLAEAQWPVEGLGFDDTGVTFSGLPFSQASSAEQLRVSVAMGFAMNPTLRTLLIRDGSLLDAENLAMVAKLAAENDGQVWIERVGAGAECSVIIEDGHVKPAAKPVPAPAPA